MTETANEKTYALFSTPNNKKLIADLEAQSKKVVKLPAFETERTTLDESSLEKLQNPARFDWIIFPDVLTVDYFLQILEENEVDLFELDDVRICAFGEAVSDRLRFVQIHTDVLPNKIEDSEIIEAIKNYVNSENGLRGLKILLIRQENTILSTTEKLIERNADASEIAIYQTILNEKAVLSKLKALIKGGAIDEFILSEPEELIYLKYLLNTEKINADLFEQWSATNEVTFKTLFEVGIKPRFFHK